MSHKVSEGCSELRHWVTLAALTQGGERRGRGGDERMKENTQTLSIIQH